MEQELKCHSKLLQNKKSNFIRGYICLLCALGTGELDT